MSTEINNPSIQAEIKTVEKIYNQLTMALNMPSYVLPEVKEHKADGGYLTYGADNQYPTFLNRLFSGSALHRAIILRKKNEIVANGLYSLSGNTKITDFLDECNNKGDSFEDIFDKIVRDYLIYGGFALQIIYTKATGKIAEIYYIDYGSLRRSLNADKIKYSKDWGKARVKSIEYDLYSKDDPTGNKIFIYNGTLTRNWYAEPEYAGALPYIEAQCQIAEYNLQLVKNGFAPSLFVNLKNGIPSIEEQTAIESQMIKRFAGASNAGKIILNFSDSDTPAAEITPIQQNNANDRYLALQEATISNIFTGHQITTPSLFGQMIAGKLGIGTEYAQGMEIFQTTYVKPNQKIILRIINRLLSINFKKCDLAINPLDPIGMVFDDQILIASQMSQRELRTLWKRWGLITTIELPAGEKPITEQDIIPKTDTTDKEVAKGPDSKQPGIEDATPA